MALNIIAFIALNTAYTAHNIAHNIFIVDALTVEALDAFTANTLIVDALTVDALKIRIAAKLTLKLAL